MAAEEIDRGGKTAAEALQQGRSAGAQGTGSSSDPGCATIPRERYAASRSARSDLARQLNSLPDQARYAPVLRDNPYCEVMDLICQLPLPTVISREFRYKFFLILFIIYLHKLTDVN